MPLTAANTEAIQTQQVGPSTAAMLARKPAKKKKPEEETHAAPSPTTAEILTRRKK